MTSYLEYLCSKYEEILAKTVAIGKVATTWAEVVEWCGDNEDVVIATQISVDSVDIIDCCAPHHLHHSHCGCFPGYSGSPAR